MVGFALGSAHSFALGLVVVVWDMVLVATCCIGAGYWLYDIG